MKLCVSGMLELFDNHVKKWIFFFTIKTFICTIETYNIIWKEIFIFTKILCCVQNVETKTDILHARLNFLKNENNDIDNKTKSRNKMWIGSFF
jgi:hypothetical protein